MPRSKEATYQTGEVVPFEPLIEVTILRPNTGGIGRFLEKTPKHVQGTSHENGRAAEKDQRIRTTDASYPEQICTTANSSSVYGRRIYCCSTPTAHTISCHWILPRPGSCL
jgi:hypothetical protein